jgi:hypothetical protein
MNLKSLLVSFMFMAVLPWSAAAVGEYGSKRISLVRGGQSGYRIIVSAEATSMEKKAAAELARYIEEITGARLPVETDKSAPKAFEISIGNTNRLNALGIAAHPDALEDDGFTLRTVDDKLVILGGKDRGALNGVYTFLETYLGCRKYSRDVSVIPKRSTIELGPIDDTQVPVFAYRELHYWNAFDPDYAAWHKLHNRDDRRQRYGLFVHTFQHLVPPEDYFEEHPEYFALNRGVRVKNTQLCLSRPEVFDILTAALADRIAQKPDVPIWSVSQNDIYGQCECPECAAVDAEEGSPAGSLLRFVNRVAARFPDRTISTLAYQYSRVAPRHTVPADNVNITLCSIECDRAEPLIAHASERSFFKDLEAWAEIAGDIQIWDYVVQFNSYVSPFPNLRVLQPNIRLFAENNVRKLFEQGSASPGTEFGELRAYLLAKLMWDPDADVRAVMDDFLFGYYGPAAEYIRHYIDLTHDALEQSGRFLDIYGHPFQHVDGFLSPIFLAAYSELFDQAEAAVKESPEHLARLRAARLPIEFAILEQAKRFGSDEGGFFERQGDRWVVRPDMRARLDHFVEGCRAANVPYLNEKGFTPEQYLRGVESLFDQSVFDSLAFEKEVDLRIPASPKYPAGGPAALTNGLKGGTEHTLNWLGFEATDLDAVIDLGEVKRIGKVRADFLHSVAYWIFRPDEVVISASRSEGDFEPIATLESKTPLAEKGIAIETFEKSIPPLEARFIRIQARNIKACPDWHIGAGGKAWIFVDEVIIN